MAKKICFLISNNFLHDNRTKRQAKALIEEGFDVTVICPAVSAKVNKEEIIEGIKIKRVLDDWLPTVPKSREHLIECRKYLKASLSEKPDIYISKDLDTLFYGWYCSKKNKAKLVYNADEYWQDLTLGGLGLKTKLYYRLVFFFAERIFIHGADLVTTVNEAIAVKMKKIFFLKKIPTVIMNSPEKMTINVNENLRKESGFKNKKIAIYVGIFSEGRGLEKFIRSSHYLDKEISLVLLGYGPQKDYLSDFIKKEKVTDRVKIIEAVSYDKLISYISSASIGVIPVQPISFSYKNCLPNKFFEYIQSELPICSSNLPVLTALIEKYEIGEVFDPFDEKDMAEKMKLILSDEERYKTYKKNLKLAKEELNWENEKEKFVFAIKELCECQS